VTQAASAPEPVSLLVVDDDPALREFVATALRLEGYRVVLAPNAEHLAQLITDERPQLVVMDVVMPGLNGVEALRLLRETGAEVPIIMLTARDEDEDKLAAFHAGADDYLVKPFNARELVARVGAVLRRTRSPAAEAEPGRVVAVGPLRLVTSRHAATLDGKPLSLTRTEYVLLLTLARSPGRVFTSADLLTRVWGPEYRDQAEILRTNIYRLRQKLESDPRHPRYLRTRQGVGYYLSAEC
jgi:two-component system KDP operon response regulator KdpE/two-component system response regulator VicR